MIKSKQDAEKYIDTLESGEDIEFMDWENGIIYKLREGNGTYLLEDEKTAERFAPRDKAIEFVYRNRKQFNKLM